MKKRKKLFEARKSAVEAEIQELQKTLSLLKFKCWYYKTAMKDGNEDAINAMLPDKLPTISKNSITKGISDISQALNWKFILSRSTVYSFFQQGICLLYQ